MTKLEVTQEFVMQLLEAVSQCDKELCAAYDKRQQTLRELNEWLQEAYEEAEG